MEAIDFAYQILDIFYEADSEIYLAGGSVRDYLLFGDFDDFDFATPCTPVIVSTILDLEKYDKYSFKFGTVKAEYLGQEIQITTFRKEGEYLDSRHPNTIKFIKNIEVDSLRRDFTINAMYLDCSGNVLDFHNGLKDLENKIIKTVGNPLERIKEDPTRILRAIRFMLKLDFTLDKELEEAIKENINLINLISKERINMEYKKMLENNKKEDILNIFNKFNFNLEEYLV